jgi:hypothetical protein
MENTTKTNFENKKIRCSNEFELCYMRHKYLRRITENPTEEEMKPYTAIVVKMAKRTYDMYKNLFSVIGFVLDDIINIGKIHLVSFLGLFSLEKMVEKYEEFIEKYNNRNGYPPSTTDIRDKNKANFTIFLKQRMEDVVRVCRQKARNIKGLPTDEFYVYCGLNEPPKNVKDLLVDNKKYGYKKVDITIFKSIKRKAKIKDKKPFQFNGLWYICIDLDRKILSLSDFEGAGLNPYDNMHNKNPEEICTLRQNEEEFEKNRETFYGHSDKKRATIIKSFIRKNRKNRFYIDEIETAKQYLENMKK